MIIGFGSTEKQWESDVQTEISAMVDEMFSEEKEEYFTESFIRSVEKAIKQMAKEHHDKADEYKIAENYPPRYSYFFPYVLGDCNHICFIFSVHHINRRHAFSPDGWALLQTKLVFDVAAMDLQRRKIA